jgi:hypothetical protein
VYFVKSLKVGIVDEVFIGQFSICKNVNVFSMINRGTMTQIKWVLLALSISFVLVSCFESTVFESSIIFKAQNTFLGLNLFLEILIFFAFSTFVVFGIKGFFEMYSQKISNVIIFLSGVFLIFVIFILCYQILFLE